MGAMAALGAMGAALEGAMACLGHGGHGFVVGNAIVT